MRIRVILAFYVIIVLIMGGCGDKTNPTGPIEPIPNPPAVVITTPQEMGVQPWRWGVREVHETAWSRGLKPLKAMSLSLDLKDDVETARIMEKARKAFSIKEENSRLYTVIEFTVDEGRGVNTYDLVFEGSRLVTILEGRDVTLESPVGSVFVFSK